MILVHSMRIFIELIPVLAFDRILRRNGEFLRSVYISLR